MFEEFSNTRQICFMRQLGLGYIRMA